jgi:hypothetical protein
VTFAFTESTHDPADIHQCPSYSAWMVDHRRPSILGGFRALIVGGLVIALTLAILDPATRDEECPNYSSGARGSGDSSAFDDTNLDAMLALALFGWFTAVVMEQVLPITTRGRSGWEIAARAMGATLLTLFLSCWVFVQLFFVCRH